jgi:hypothetical protein
VGKLPKRTYTLASIELDVQSVDCIPTIVSRATKLPKLPLAVLDEIELHGYLIGLAPIALKALETLVDEEHKCGYRPGWRELDPPLRVTITVKDILGKVVGTIFGDQRVIGPNGSQIAKGGVLDRKLRDRDF